MDPIALARWQFAILTVYHFLIVPLSIGLTGLVAVMQTMAYRRRGTDAETTWERATAFWGRIMLVIFARGVASRVGLHDLVRQLPDGWSTPAGADGAGLSGGQRQRLLVARALLADPAILVLDEPSAHLDAATERHLLDTVLDATAGRTVLRTTHRQLGPGRVDQVLRVDGGRLVPDGH